MKKLAFILAACLLLVGCSNTPSSVDSVLSMEQLEIEDSVIDNNHVINPTEEYVVQCLKLVDEINEISDNSIEDSSISQDGCFAVFYFSSSLIDQDKVYGDTLVKKGTESGGSIELYDTEENANKRNDYLQSFDGSWLLDPGYHTVLGTIVVRTSKLFSEQEHNVVENKIITALLTNQNEQPSETPNNTSDIVTTTSISETDSVISDDLIEEEIEPIEQTIETTSTNEPTKIEPPKEENITTDTTATSKDESVYIPPSSVSENHVSVPKEEETVGNLVWVPTNGGKRYHSYSGCSNMKDPMQVTVETAIANGYTPCGRCH